MRSAILFSLIAATLLSCSQKPDIGIKAPEGMSAEKVFSPTENNMGSWVSLATLPGNKMIASDQYGALYTFTPPVKGLLKREDIDSLDINIGFAQGMVWFRQALYVMVNIDPRPDAALHSGLHVVTDRDKDGRLDTVTPLIHMDGSGEHGPHGIVVGPDSLLYLVAGNHTLIPHQATFAMADNWGEDNILPVIKDPRGHANHVKAPGGWVARTDGRGDDLEVIAVGFRNSYDLAFNAAGDLFTFDSDMEWDMGTPWYRPIRICHITEGADFGWRTGSGKFPEYYPDNLPPVLSMAQGSPTGILYSRDIELPERYSDGLVVLDWSFGTAYYVDLQDSGDTYKAEYEVLFSGNSLPLTDIVSFDGDIYFTTGGRRLGSGLYRLANRTKQEDWKPPVKSVRRPFETDNLDSIWDELGSESMVRRYAARTALEKLDSMGWIDRIATETDPDIIIQSVIALARIAPPIDENDVVSWLGRIPFAKLQYRQQLDLIRAYQLVLIRLGRNPSIDHAVSGNLGSFYPSNDGFLDRELSKLLCTVDDPHVVGSSMAILNNTDETVPGEWLDEDVRVRSDQYGEIISLIKKNSPETRRLGLLEALSVADSGWTDVYREMYFTSFQQIFTSTGGASYKGFAVKILERSLENLSGEQQAMYREMSGVDISRMNDSELSELPKPEGPGRAWKTDEVMNLIDRISSADAVNGERMFRAVLCASCHSVGGTGENTGPDLTTLAARFSVEDVIISLMDPSASISDQYVWNNYLLEDSSRITGRELLYENDTLLVSTNPFSSEQTRRIPRARVLDISPSGKSVMPPGLINRLNNQELADLLAYLMSLDGGITP